MLNALVKKGVLSDQEAKEIMTQDKKAYDSTAAHKIKLASSIKNITFYGDLRLRYELSDGVTGDSPTTTTGRIYGRRQART